MKMAYQDLAKRREYNREYYRKRLAPRRRKEAQARLGTEKKGILSCRIPLSLIARIRRMVLEGVATGCYPWKAISDAVQALLVKGMESMAGDPLVDEMLPYLRAVSQIEGVASHRIEAQAAFSKIKTEISELLAIRAHDEAVQYFHAIYHSVDDMNANVWRDWLLRKLQGEFPRLLKERPKGISLVDKKVGRRK